MNLTCNLRSARRAWLIGLLVIYGGCATTPVRPGVADEIIDVLKRQAVAWNAGDIEGFMHPYRRSEELTFSSGGKVTRGWERTMRRYRELYPTREAMGRLTFSHLEITDLEGEAALVLGRWKLEREEPVGGAFTLVLRREGDEWIIIHDHTSRDAP